MLVSGNTAPFVVEEVTVHNTGISLLFDKCSLKSGPRQNVKKPDQRLNVPVHGRCGHRRPRLEVSKSSSLIRRCEIEFSRDFVWGSKIVEMSSNFYTYNTSDKSEFIWFCSYRDIGQKRNSHTKSLNNSISQWRIRLLDLLTSSLGLLWCGERRSPTVQPSKRPQGLNPGPSGWQSEILPTVPTSHRQRTARLITKSDYDVRSVVFL